MNPAKSLTGPIVAALILPFCLAVSMAPASASIIALRLDDSVSGLTTTTAALDAGTAPAIGTNDNQWGFNSTNNQALVTVSPEADNLASYVFGSRVDLGENSPAFDTVIGGLDSGTEYNIYAYYVASTFGTDDWGIQAGLNGGGLAYYNDEDGVLLATGPFSIQLHRVLLGTVSGTTTATVNFDDSAGLGITTNPRSFVKGIGVEAVPEPSSMLLGGLGLCALLLRRRD